jgi:hypothetical protein
MRLYLRTKCQLLTAAMLITTLSSSAFATIFINDNFSTFNNGNLVGAPNAGDGWSQLGASGTLPLQVSGGNVVIPGGQTVDNQDAVKSLGSTVTSTVYMGLSLTLNSAPSSGASYFVALQESSGSFANERVAAIDNAAIPGTYFLESRYTGQAGNPFVAGTNPLVYGQTYNLVVEAIITPTGVGEGMKLFINPTNNNEGTQTPYLVESATTGFLIPPVGINAAIISQFGSATTHNSGVAFDHVTVADTFAEAANVPEPSTIALASIGAVIGYVALRRRKK